MPTMTPTLTDADRVTRIDFARLVTLHLRMSGREPDQVDLGQWLDATWPLVEDNMDPALWASEYLAACRVRGAVQTEAEGVAIGSRAG
jgi:hypothetical protein